MGKGKEGYPMWFGIMDCLVIVSKVYANFYGRILEKVYAYFTKEQHCNQSEKKKKSGCKNKGAKLQIAIGNNVEKNNK